MYFITKFVTLFRNSLKHNHFIGWLLAGFALLSMLFFILIWSLMTQETMFFFFAGYIAFATTFSIVFVIMAIQEDPNKVLPKHREYKARKLTQKEQDAWRAQIKEYLAENYGKWSKLAAASYFEMQEGVVAIAFPYDASTSPVAIDKQPLPSAMQHIHWQLWLGVKVYNTSQPHLFPADISIIRRLNIKNAAKVPYFFEKIKTEMQRYL